MCCTVRYIHPNRSQFGFSATGDLTSQTCVSLCLLLCIQDGDARDTILLHIGRRCKRRHSLAHETGTSFIPRLNNLSSHLVNSSNHWITTCLSRSKIQIMPQSWFATVFTSNSKVCFPPCGQSLQSPVVVSSLLHFLSFPVRNTS